MNRATKVLKSYLRNISLFAVRNSRFVMELFDNLRRRKGGVNEEKDAQKEEEIKSSDRKNSKKVSDGASRVDVEPGTYWLTRIVFLRSLGLIYCKLFENRAYMLH